MLSRRGKSLHFRPSFAGTGLLERMRSTTFALLGITAAVGLGLVATLSQQSWPLLPSAPLPGLPSEGQVHDAAPVKGADTVSTSRPAVGPLAGGVRTSDRRVAGQRAGQQTSGLSESRQPAAAAPPAPADLPADDPTGEPPSPAPAPVAEAPSSSAPPAPSQSSVPPATPSTSASDSPPPAITAATNQGKGKPKAARGKSRGYEPAPAPPPKPAKGKSRKAETAPAPAPPPPTTGKKEEPVVAPVPEESASNEKGNAYGHSKK